MNYEHEKRFIPNLLREAYKQIVKDKAETSSFMIYDKGINDLVTECDYAVERFIKERIIVAFPGDALISEELHSESAMSRRTWVLDPIDGTVNFSYGVKLFGIQIALLESGSPVLSAIYLPCWDEMYLAVKGEGVTLNGTPIKTADTSKMIDSMVTLGDFSSSDPRVRAAQLEVIAKTHDSVRKIKMLGTSCVDFAFLAAGKTQGHIIFTQNLWDLMPGYFMAMEAGASSNYDSVHPSEFIICAANEALLKELIEKIGNLGDFTIGRQYPNNVNTAEEIEA